VANGHTCKWVEDEDIKLNDAVQTHGDNNWVAVAALVPGRTKKQCYSRWHEECLGSQHRPGEWAFGKMDGCPLQITHKLTWENARVAAEALAICSGALLKDIWSLSRLQKRMRLSLVRLMVLDLGWVVSSLSISLSPETLPLIRSDQGWEWVTGEVWSYTN
jgi:hypothetical protein